MGDELPRYRCKPATDVATVDRRQQEATISMAPLQAFPIIRGGDLGRAEDEVKRATKPGAADRPWRTYRARSVTCLHPAMIVVADDNEIIQETWTTHKALRHVPEFSDIERTRMNALWEGEAFNAPQVHPARKLTGSYVLPSSAPQGYFHWLVEYLPNISLLRDGDSGQTLLMPPLNHRWQTESLSAVGVAEAEFVELDGHTHVSGELTFADRIMLDECHVAPAIVPFFRDLHERYRSGARRRLFVSRAAAARRNVTNEDAILERLTPLGFERVEAEALSFAEQISLFTDAEIVVGPHGAGLTNAVFCAPGTIVVELNYATFRSPSAGVTSFAALSELFDLKYGLVLGEAVHSPWRSYKRRNPTRRDRISDFEVAPDAVLRMVQELRRAG